jgi:hypothetical protein
LLSLAKIFPRLASIAPLKCLTFAHLLCPAIALNRLVLVPRCIEASEPPRQREGKPARGIGWVGWVPSDTASELTVFTCGNGGARLRRANFERREPSVGSTESRPTVMTISSGQRPEYTLVGVACAFRIETMSRARHSGRSSPRL